MSAFELPAPVASYLSAKEAANPSSMIECFTEDATVYDNGEEIVLRGADEIQQWFTRTVGAYELTSVVNSVEWQGPEIVVGVVVSGKFPGSPYQFENRYRLKGDKIAVLAINPLGSLAE